MTTSEMVFGLIMTFALGGCSASDPEAPTPTPIELDAGVAEAGPTPPSTLEADAGKPANDAGATDGGSKPLTMDVSGVKGTFNGKSFAAVSGFAFINADKTVDIVFSDNPDVCASVKQNKYRPNETWVQVYDLKKGSGDSYAPVSPDDFKVFVADATCKVAYRADTPSPYSVTLTQADANGVAGSFSATFSGSEVHGNFTLALCSQSVGKPTCP